MYSLDFLIPKKAEPLKEDAQMVRVVEDAMRKNGYAATADGPLPRIIVDAILRSKI